MRATMAALLFIGASGSVWAQQAPRPDGLIAKWTAQNSQCRGGHGDDPKTMAACRERSRTGREIDARGWCYGKKDQIAAQYQWHACTRASLQPDS